MDDREIITGTDDSDRIVAGNAHYAISAGAGNNRIQAGDGANIVESGDGNDQISSGNGANEIRTSGGRNKISAGNGENLIESGSGDDTIVVGNGDNVILSGHGRSRITAGDGNNEIAAGSGADAITAGGGGNVIDAGDGKNKITAGDGDNVIVVGDDSDTVTVGDGRNRITAEGGQNRITAGDGGNDITTGGGRDQIKAGDGANRITSAGGDNRITAGDGGNDITTGHGRDQIKAGDGDNRITSAGGDNRITAGDGGNDITTGQGRDQITAGDGDNRITSAGGDNRITAGDGSNDITTGDGRNTIKAGDGDNRIDAGSGRNSITLGKGDNTVNSGSGDDSFKLGHGSNAIDAGDGKNRIKAGNGDNTIVTGSGNDDIRLGHGGNDVTAAGGNNGITLGNGQNTITTGDGTDRIRAGNGGNVITSGGGNDRIQTGKGDDEISGGEGNDHINAGAGYDTAVFNGSFDDYTIDLSRYRSGRGSITITGLSEGDGDQGKDVLTGVEALYFEAEGFLLDLTQAESVVAEESEVAIDSAGDMAFAVGDVTGSDWEQQSRYASASFDALSAGGVEVEFDGETVTYNGQGVLEGLAEGETFRDSFTYTLTDLFGNEQTATVDVTLTGTGGAPVARDDVLRAPSGGDMALTPGDVIRVNEETPSGTSVRDSETVALADGRFAVIWRQGAHITAKILEADGTASTEPFQVNEAPNYGTMYYSLTALEDGGLAIGWKASTGSHTFDNENYVRVFNADGTARTPEFSMRDERFADDGPAVLTSEITALKGGGFVAVWSENEEYGKPDFDIKAAIFDDNGNRVKNDFEITEYGAGRQTYPAVAGLPDGGFVAVWTSGGSGDSDARGISARLFDKNGNPVSDEFLVNDQTAGLQGYARVEAHEDGSFAVMWYTQASGYDVSLKVFNADGTAASEEQQVNLGSMDGATHRFDLAWLPSGQLVVAWTENDQDGYALGHRVAVYNADGTLAVPSVAIAPFEGNYELSPEIAILGEDRFGIVQSEPSGDEIYVKFFDLSQGSDGTGFTDGNSIAEIPVADLLANDSDPDGDALAFALSGTVSKYGAALSYDAATGTVSYDPTGAAAVQALAGGEILEDSFTYTVTDPSGASSEATVTIEVGGSHATAGAIDDQFGEMPQLATALQADQEFTVNETDFAHSVQPAVTATGDGGAIVVWDVFGSSTGASSSGIWCRITGADGSTVVSEFEVTGADVYATTPSVTLLDGGRFAVSWTETVEAANEFGEATVVKAQTYNADGTAAGDVFQVSGSSPDSHSDAGIVALEDGNIAVVWLSHADPYDLGNQLNAAVYTPSGQAVAAEFVISDTAGAGDRYLVTPQVAAVPGGGFMVSWTDTDTVRVAAYGNDGAETVAPHTVTAASGSGAFGSASISVNDDGSYVVVWKHRDANDNHTGDSSLQAAVFEADGSVRVDAFTVKDADGSMRFGTETQVETLPNGQFVVVWDAYPEPGNYAFDVYAQVFNADGSEAAAEFKVNEYASYNQYRTDVAVLDEDSFMITWESYTEPHHASSEIVARVFDMEGTPVERHFSTEDEVAEIALQDLLANDVLGNSEAFEFALAGPASDNGAAVSYDADSGLVFYDPTAAAALQELALGEALQDTFTYTLTDANGGTSEATVTLVVGGLDELDQGIAPQDHGLFL